ncbi:carbonic anhydrase [Lentzea albidocapillata]|uniref:Carbonic anhydrase n=1 Tax=Lentzea albidocapillata TaxID=40571 RepID=A0A1W2ESG1_9PSEU|nr:carbonic anhydrase [Lentzea albidocapillata]SMD12660.1 carbonic anhydrase [Lentzea albidocapillata]
MDFHRFVQHARAHAASRSRALGRKLAAGQQPTTMFITCADSRIVTAAITGAEPGSLFELRTAGNVIPPYSLAAPTSEMATIEFAVLQLGVSEIVVCGHSHCGAVGALHGGGIDHLPAMRGWLRPGQLHESSDPAMRAEGQDHVRTQLDVLLAYPFVADKVASGELRVHGWFYDIETGQVSACAEHAFLPL